MKTKMNLIASVVILLLLASPANGHNDKDRNKQQKDTLRNADHIIEISSVLTIKGMPAGNYDLFLSLDGNIVDTIKVEKAKPIFFDLDKNKFYGLVFKKEGYPDKIVMINTYVPTSISKSRYFNADIEIELDTETSTQKRDFIDFPVATFHFDSQKQEFDYSHKYYKTVHAK